MKCIVCGCETEHTYKIYCDSAVLDKNGANTPNSVYLSGNAQTLTLRSGHDIYLEYNMPLCQRCTYTHHSCALM